MKRTVAGLLCALLALPALAAEPPPPPPDGELGYYESCFGVPHGRPANVGVFIEQPIPIGGGSGGVSVPSVSGGKDDKAWLVVAVLAVMALPVVVYAVDSPPPPIVLQRFQCPTFSMDLIGGADNSHDALGAGSYGVFTTRFGFGYGHLATDFQFDAAATTVSSFSGHLLLRPTPKAHVDGGFAIGYRRQVFGGQYEDGLELGLPHRYALWRDELRTFALEIRPFLLIGQRVEPNLEAAFVIPLAQVLHLRLGGRVYTFNGDLFWGLSAGMNITL